MTRRTRFTPFVLAGVFVAGLAGDRRADAVEIPFVAQPTLNAGARVFDLTQGDIDRDGDVDLVSASRIVETSPYSGVVHWYENAGGSFTQRTIYDALGGAILSTVSTADMDGDGDLDVIAMGIGPDVLQWFENVGGNGSAWTRHTVGTMLFGGDAQPGDVDGDGDMDLVVGTGDRVVWLEQTAVPAWTVHTLTTFLRVPSAVVPVDVDGDGDLDVVYGGMDVDTQGTFDSVVQWAENLSGTGSNWAIHGLLVHGYTTYVSLAVGDLDGDGDRDIVAGYANGYLTWVENDGAPPWPIHTIPYVFGAVSAVGSVADLDTDGDLDILAGFAGRSFWFENAAGNASVWTRRTVEENNNDAGLAFLAADLDDDGDPDYAFGTWQLNRVQWFRNDSIHRSACFAPAAAISTASPGAVAVAAADVDGDGAPDVVATSGGDDAVRWHENAAGNGSSWLPHTVTTATSLPFSVTAADVDGDGDMDLLSADAEDDAVAWYENLGGAGLSWTARTIATLITSARAVSAADVDSDGDTDVVSAAYYDGLRWFANTTGNGTAWTPWVIAGAAGGSAVTIADMNRDGDLDVVGSPGNIDPVVRWNDNTAGNGTAWTPRTIAPLGPSLSWGVAPADVDRDGDLDIVGSFTLSSDAGLRWFSNLDGAGGSWTSHTISTRASIFLAVGDLDRDGDLDAASTGLGDVALRWHDHDAGGWTERTIATAANQCAGVAAADLDRDGDLDVVAATPGDNRIDWFANRGGQFALDTTDIAPPSAENGTEAAMLRVMATHRGRAGDGSLELAGLGLLFEEAAGDPLTSAEANAVIESLRVYRDLNGSGVFEPGTDVLVTEVPMLSLTAGVQDVPFTDGDANVEIAFGTPRTYFVVVALTADASAQTPNRFRVTLLGLGPSASRAEDRTYDIPLVPACPADVASAFMATPVTLTGFTVE
jgi:hypothetical protein